MTPTPSHQETGMFILKFLFGLVLLAFFALFMTAGFFQMIF